MFKEIFATI